jgi:hypothetical protein
MHTPFTRDEWLDLLDRYFPAYKRWQDLDYRISVAGSTVPEEVVQEYDGLNRLLSDLRSQYQAGLPFLPVSRCPFSGQVVYHSIDPFGIEGLWWNYSAPVRPMENLPVTFLAITGALRMKGAAANTPFVCVPGPGAPYVLPELLGHKHIAAVVSSLPVGNHTGYVIMYFSDNDRVRVPRPDSWGMDHWELLDRDGAFGWGKGTVGIHEAGFDLVPWLEKKKLFWIRPKDRALALWSGTAGCPYVGLDGTHSVQRVRAGIVQQEPLQE